MPGGSVFLEYTQQALDDAYDQAVYAPNRDQILARVARNSQLAWQRSGGPLRLAYGPSEIEQLDVYKTARPGAPIHVYIHGGAWRSRRSAEFAFAAEMFTNAGAHFVVPDFINVVEADGDLFRMVDQVRRALAWVHRNAAALAGDSEEIYVSGSSSGAHLAAVLAATDWRTHGLPADPVKGYTLTSGMYDLRGPRLSKRSRYVKFTDEMEHQLSPQRHLDRIRAPIALLYGSLETPEFQRQSREFAAALQKAGKQVELMRFEGYNHFEISETMGNPYGPVGHALLKQMRLSPYWRQ